jgi:hypothetical protein
VRGSQLISQQSEITHKKIWLCEKGAGGGHGRENWWADRRMTTAREGCRDPPPFETTAQRRDRVAGRGRARHGHGPRLPSPVPPHALRPNNQSPFHSAVQPFILPLTAPVLLLPSLRLCTFQCRHLSSQAQPVSPSPSPSPCRVGVHAVDLYCFHLAYGRGQIIERWAICFHWKFI